MIGAILIIIFGFVLTAFFSGMEMAFVSCNKLRVRHRAKEGDHAAQLIDKLQRRQKRVLASVLLYTNVGNVSLTAAFAYILEERFHVIGPWFGTLILAPIIIIFAEMVPKDFCRERANELIYSMAKTLKWSTQLSARLVEGIIAVTDRVLAQWDPVELKKSPFVTRSELRALIHESAERGLVLDHEKRLIDKIFEFEHRPVEEIMQPVGTVAKISVGASVKQLKSAARKSHRGGFWALVYDRNVSNIVGVVHVFDVLFEQDESENIQPFLRTPLFVRGVTSNEETFLLLQAKRQSMAVVLDKQDRAVGVITVNGLIQL